MRKIWTMIGSLLIFTGLKSQEPVKVKKETTPVKKSTIKEKMYKGEVIPKFETATNNQSGLYVKVDSINRKEALKGHIYLKVEGLAYSGAKKPFVYIKIGSSTLPSEAQITKYVKGESVNKGHVYLKFEGIKGETSSKGIDIYLKALGTVSDGEKGIIYVKLDAPPTGTAAAVDYYLKIPGVKGESK